jgi:hypothetical protein
MISCHAVSIDVKRNVIQGYVANVIGSLMMSNVTVANQRRIYIVTTESQRNPSILIQMRLGLAGLNVSKNVTSF